MDRPAYRVQVRLIRVLDDGLLWARSLGRRPWTAADLVGPTASRRSRWTDRGCSIGHSPGGGWRYSGPGFVVAALVIESATHRTYGEVAAELVLEPANLHAITSGAFPDSRGDAAIGHHRGQPLDVHPGFAYIPGTGDLWTTTDDLVRLNQAIRAGQVIEPEAAAQLWTPHVQIGGSDDGGPIVMDAYGYGTFLGRLNGREARINPGDNPGYQSLLVYLHDNGVDLAVLCNEDAPSVNAALADLALPTEGRGSLMPCAGCSDRHRVLIFAGKPLCIGVRQPAEGGNCIQNPLPLGCGDELRAVKRIRHCSHGYPGQRRHISDRRSRRHAIASIPGPAEPHTIGGPIPTATWTVGMGPRASQRVVRWWHD